MKRKLRKLPLVLAVLALAAAVFGGGALVARREARKPVRLPEAATLTPATVGRPGDPALAAAEFALPWGVEVVGARVEAGGDMAAEGAPRINSKWRWGKRLWRVEATIRPLGSGGTAPGRLVIELDRALPGSDGGRCEVAVPALKVADAPAAAPSRPRLADREELPAPKRVGWWWYLAVAAAVAAAAGAVWIILRRRARREAEVPPPWEVARAELARLRSLLAERGFRAELGTARLSDILKNYLAARFGLPAVTETGCAFLDGASNDLTADELEFLRGFFAAADLVKFARLPADRYELERFVAAASALVERTVPPPESAKKEAAS